MNFFKAKNSFWLKSYFPKDVEEAKRYTSTFSKGCAKRIKKGILYFTFSIDIKSYLPKADYNIRLLGRADIVVFRNILV